MYIKELTLTDYRNYNNVKINFNIGINVFWGDNGAGKTNILEAIYLTSAGRSHRTSRDKDMIRQGAQEAFINIKVIRKDGETDVNMMIPQNGSKRVKVNGKYINRIAQLMGIVTAVIFSPEDLKLVKEGPEERRRFIDIFISQIRPDYLYNLQKYYKILENRNKTLKDIKYGHASRDLLAVWNEQLAYIGTELLEQRLYFVDKICAEVSDIHKYITDHKENLKLRYKSTLNLSGDIKQNFTSALNQRLDADINMGTTTIGPHRDDMIILVNDMDMRYYGSQGQQRTAALSLKLGQLEVTEDLIGEPPVLLLDDVMSELDIMRQNMLMSYMKRYQTMMTCIRKSDYLEQYDKKTFFYVENGQVSI